MRIRSWTRLVSGLPILFGLILGSCSGSGPDGKKPGKQDDGTPVDISMVAIGGGTFFNGTANMTVSDFKLGAYDVTQAQYFAVMGVNPSYFSGDPKRPVESVKWYDALVFCNRLSLRNGLSPVYSIGGSTDTDDWGAAPVDFTDTRWDQASMDRSADGFRLPTEAEWEWAAMGGNSDSRSGDIVGCVNTGGDQKYFAGSNGTNAFDDYAWHLEGSEKTMAVGQKLANELGLYDMSGNVYQWCWDKFGNYPSSAQTDYEGFSGPTTTLYFIVRGGSYYDDIHGGYIDPVGMRSRYQGFNINGYFGFRVAQS
jgi:formylglycine-generating enzyme required for sulfatase activity